MIVTLISYAVDAWLLFTYFRLGIGDTGPRPFHWANALGGPVLIVGTLVTVGWVPILVLTIAFTLLGWLGLYNTRKART